MGKNPNLDALYAQVEADYARTSAQAKANMAEPVPLSQLSESPSAYSNFGGKGRHYSDKGSHQQRSLVNAPQHANHRGGSKEENYGRTAPTIIQNPTNQAEAMGLTFIGGGAYIDATGNMFDQNGVPVSLGLGNY